MSSRETVASLVRDADIQIGGTRPWDIVVHNERFYDRVLAEGSLGLGESYMDGWWDAEALDEFFTRLLKAGIDRRARLTARDIIHAARARLFNLAKRRAYEVGEAHYDIGNDIYRTMLDRRMTYTCGYWKDARTLEEAQEAKLDLICRKIGIGKNDAVLDIGSGWGSFIHFAAERYGADALGVTVSKEQARYANEYARAHGIKAETKLSDYRELTGSFSRIVSVGMFEHVGYKNYREFMEKAHSLLRDDGLFLLHTIGGNRSVAATDPWIEKYIFPNSMLPSIKQIGAAIEDLFVMEDWHNFGADYDRTLMEWFRRFDAGWERLKDSYDERFYRMWKYYLLASAGSFRSRKNQLWQIVLSKHGVPGGYQSVR